MSNPNDKNKETVDSSANTNVPMENTHISDPHIIPFDSENGMKMELWMQYFNDTCKQHNKNEDWKVKNILKFFKGSALTHYINYCLNICNFDDLCSALTEKFLQPIVVNFANFSQHYLKKNDDLVKYFHEKLNCGRKLGLSPQLILEGLTDGLPTQFKQLMTVQSPKTPTEWLTLATKLFKIQESSEQSAVVNNEPTVVTRPNFSPRQSTFIPRPQNSFFRPNFQNFSRSRPNNFVNPHSNTSMYQGFRPNHNTHFQNRLPSSPCRICTRQGIPNAYHWTQLCPLRQPQFTCDLPITNNSVSQCTGNSVISSQVTNGSENTASDRQNPSTEASGPVY
ncbi:hypothetical protein AVEN_136766-1 [Araneus ventricosus]|uniref:Uncharacterized protein n=1 Tax=Araneus ventricosus TaxID=182803 RepID=A0A4Y2BUN8_ARAVE|nr:hypothetical protein AVEN_10169-1 [Araneus ventricosus]GBL95981.1 hypothetical protein AVEN_136766-1 [Araneus ventricosus]